MIYNLGSNINAGLDVGAHFIVPRPDSAEDTDDSLILLPWEQDLEPLSDAECDRISRTQIHIMQRPERRISCPGGIKRGSLALVDQEIAQVIEDIDPGMHQFIPLQDVWFKPGVLPPKVQATGYFGLWIYQNRVTVDLKASRLHKPKPGWDPKMLLMFNALVPEHRVIYAASETGCHLWRDTASREVFCSETFKTAIEARTKRSGIAFKECRVIPGP